MVRRPPSSTSTDQPLPESTLFRCQGDTQRGAHLTGGVVEGGRDALLVLRERRRDGGGRRTHRETDPDGENEEPGDHGEVAAVAIGERSEEHTSELQSLMRISYADFCLKQQTTNDPRRGRNTT